MERGGTWACGIRNSEQAHDNSTRTYNTQRKRSIGEESKHNNKHISVSLLGVNIGGNGVKLGGNIAFRVGRRLTGGNKHALSPRHGVERGAIEVFQTLQSGVHVLAAAIAHDLQRGFCELLRAEHDAVEAH